MVAKERKMRLPVIWIGCQLGQDDREKPEEVAEERQQDGKSDDFLEFECRV